MSIYDDIVQDEQNKSYTTAGLYPIFSVPKSARILIIGQAPGKRVQDTGIMWNDASGDRLREWLGVDRSIFYDSGKIAVIPMDFYYPGKAKSGDKPPRRGIAEKWHPKLRAQMPNIQLTILIGAYAQRYYLNLAPKTTITSTVQNFAEYLPEFFPIVHPSPRNNIWLKKNPWFLIDVIPKLQKQIAEIIQV
ncbi:uracil-DNA glycosylase family protein [Liquorilactobacillus mali]|uniref:Uracil-DNA glycosylase n=1 Tax=Liquorilactobacillus mali KCTC 3596 = DSM 20444 TaxID=1046596 RepID=J0USD8_9LACO|nr:uracil-DNA glycosylase family protein [Liquorilactobacillus mali]EJE99836.1 uracil-DNA glycosylase [Liquorilactobacillus mali KCTC 3596 = DSM 20444]KRN10315.1 uracil-DNA glycosylase [Liquorilactobacillus mali KCTC 3596 = DSM 20444]MDC7953408.1 uracil-DNA glycosylase family protein [Liquorilactobacillus mali]MDV7757782.1 uracil-DNA glycosylase family protein [Liquorilactobacillus mali]QFQ75528.1 uracil-DNA glycosylase family protein [Liquorilactobacillus mali]